MHIYHFEFIKEGQSAPLMNADCRFFNRDQQRPIVASFTINRAGLWGPTRYVSVRIKTPPSYIFGHGAANAHSPLNACPAGLTGGAFSFPRFCRIDPRARCRLFELWIACYTQEEIAEREECDRLIVQRALENVQNGKVAEMNKNDFALSEHAVDFDTPISTQAIMRSRITIDC